MAPTCWVTNKYTHQRLRDSLTQLARQHFLTPAMTANISTLLLRHVSLLVFPLPCMMRKAGWSAGVASCYVTHCTNAKMAHDFAVSAARKK